MSKTLNNELDPFEVWCLYSQLAADKSKALKAFGDSLVILNKRLSIKPSWPKLQAIRTLAKTMEFPSNEMVEINKRRKNEVKGLERRIKELDTGIAYLKMDMANTIAKNPPLYDKQREQMKKSIARAKMLTKECEAIKRKINGN